MAFFQTLSVTYQTVLAFFPRWFSTAVTTALVALGVALVIGVAQRLKNIFWPF